MSSNNKVDTDQDQDRILSILFLGFLTPRENPRRRSVGPQKWGQSLGFSSGGSKEIGQNLYNGSENSENQ